MNVISEYLIGHNATYVEDYLSVTLHNLFGSNLDKVISVCTDFSQVGHFGCHFMSKFDEQYT